MGKVSFPKLPAFKENLTNTCPKNSFYLTDDSLKKKRLFKPLDELTFYEFIAIKVPTVSIICLYDQHHSLVFHVENGHL